MATDPAARVYDLYDAPMDAMGGARRRRRVLARSEGRVLEVGIGTGRNLDHYPARVRLVGVDLSPRILARAARRAAIVPGGVALVLGDAQRLPFPAASFDTVTATCVFCSVTDPVAGLREVARVVRPGGRVLLLEHVRPEHPLLGWLFDRLSPLTRRLFGPELNRRTEGNAVAAGLRLVGVRRGGIWREITAVPDAGADPAAVGPPRAGNGT